MWKCKEIRLLNGKVHTRTHIRARTHTVNDRSVDRKENACAAAWCEDSYITSRCKPVPLVAIWLVFHAPQLASDSQKRIRTSFPTMCLQNHVTRNGWCCILFHSGYNPGQKKKIVTAEIFMRLICSLIMWYRSKLTSTSTRPAVSARCELASQIEVDIAWSNSVPISRRSRL